MDASGRITGRPVNTGEVSHTSSSEGAPFPGREVRLGEGEGAARVPVHEGSVPQAELHKRDVEVGERDQGDLSYLESMPAEVREQIAGELDTHELGSLSQISTTMRDTSVAEGMKRLLGSARDGDGGPY